MTIADDGVGMSKEKIADGIGLRNIRGRVTTLNGETKVISAKGKGFKLEIRIPLRLI
jgi:signal transduction histidine kinase